jgi:Tol biopolymer transport system component
MSELKEVFEMVTKQTEPDMDSWNQQERRQRRSARNRRFGGFAVVACILAVTIVAVVVARDEGLEPTDTAGGHTSEGQRNLAVMDVRTGRAVAFPDVNPDASDFSFSLDGSTVAYTDIDASENVQVFVMEADGSSARQLTEGEGGARHPSWSPDGSRIAYERDTSDDSQIFVVSVSDGESTQVTDEPGGAVDPGGWTPDGGSIIFSALNASATQYAAYSLDLATGETRLIVDDASTPTLSPDGAWIAFNSWSKEPQVRLILARSDGSDRRVIGPLDNSEDARQRWSPDSEKIAFVHLDDVGDVTTFVLIVAGDGVDFRTTATLEAWVDNDHILVS